MEFLADGRAEARPLIDKLSFATNTSYRALPFQKGYGEKLALFGSVLRDDLTPASDVDVLVEFEPGYTPGLAFFAIQREPSAMLGRHVDLHTAPGWSPYFRQEGLDGAEVLSVAP